MSTPDPQATNAQIFATLQQVVAHLPDFASIERPLARLGASAANAGIQPGQYTIFRDELLFAMSQLAGDDWSHELACDWTLVLDAVAGAMLPGVWPVSAAA